MVHPAFLLAVLAGKLFLAFKAGQKYSANSISEAAKKEMEEMHIPQDYADNLIGKIMSRIKDKDIEIGDFVEIMKSVYEDIKENVDSGITAVTEKTAGLTDKFRASMADLLVDAALFLSPKKKEQN